MMNLALILLSLAAVTCSRGIRSDFVLVNESYTFPFSICETSQWRKTSPSRQTIARCSNHVCTVEDAFKERFTVTGDRLLLKAARYSDQMRYEFVCNRQESSLRLDVIYALRVHVAAMESVTLNCFANDAKDVTWLRGEEQVLHRKKNSPANIRKAYEGRASLPDDCFESGNFSLTIKTDGGIFRCFVNDQTDEGYPHAYVIHANETSVRPEEQTQELLFYKICTTVLSLLLAAIGLVYLIKAQPCKTRPEPEYGLKPESEPEPESETELEPQNQPFISESVQESSTTGNKASTTRPFSDL